MTLLACMYSRAACLLANLTDKLRMWKTYVGVSFHAIKDHLLCVCVGSRDPRNLSQGAFWRRIESIMEYN